MKSERRHELQQNSLKNWLESKSGTLGAQSSWIIAGLIAIILVFVFVQISSSRRANNLTEAWNDLYSLRTEARTTDQFQSDRAITGLEALADEHRGSEVGRFAKMAIGDTYMLRGGAALFQSRQTSREMFGKAATYFSQIISDSKAPQDMIDVARFRRARSYEWRNQISDAIEDYKATKDSGSPYASLAENQLALLSQPNIRKWYDEFDGLDLTRRPAASAESFPDTEFSSGPDAIGTDQDRLFDTSAFPKTSDTGPSPDFDSPLGDDPLKGTIVTPEPKETDETAEIDLTVEQEDTTAEATSESPAEPTDGDTPEATTSSSQSDSKSSPDDSSEAAPTEDNSAGSEEDATDSTDAPKSE